MKRSQMSRERKIVEIKAKIMPVFKSSMLKMKKEFA